MGAALPETLLEWKIKTKWKGLAVCRKMCTPVSADIERKHDWQLKQLDSHVKMLWPAKARSVIGYINSFTLPLDLFKNRNES